MPEDKLRHPSNKRTKFFVSFGWQHRHLVRDISIIVKIIIQRGKLWCYKSKKNIQQIDSQSIRYQIERLNVKNSESVENKQAQRN